MRPPVGMSLAEPAPSSGLSDERLIADAQAGNGQAFDALLTVRLDRTYRTARAILGNEPDARDAVQDAWLSIWRRLPDLRQPSAFDGWIDRIVVNACRTRLRERGRVREIQMPPGFDHRDQSLGSRPEGVAERDAVERAFERLNPDQRAILVLHHVHHQPVVAIAAALGIPDGTVK